MKRLTICAVPLVLLLSGCASDCILKTAHAVPAYRLPCEFRTGSHAGKVPIDLALLGIPPQDEHILGPRDVVGVYAAGVLPPKLDEAPYVHERTGGLTQKYYPPNGDILTPGIGVPFEIHSKGSIRLPLVGNVLIAGKTLDEAAEEIRSAYNEAGVLQKNRDRVIVTLLRSRVHRIMVLRDDSEGLPQRLRKEEVPYTKKGFGDIVDLPAGENDILHALSITGGLPGIDVYNEVWVFRRRKVGGEDFNMLQEQLKDSLTAQELAERWVQEERQLVRIPLRLLPDEPIPFGPQDITLEDGDVLYLRPREIDYFYTGGLLFGGKIPLPRDQDIDVLEAIALANGSVGGPGAIGAVFRTGPGNVLPPTRVLIVRKLPNGQQIPIRVDLAKAVDTPQERILIMPEDQVYLFYKPKEFYTNLLLNYIGFNFTAVIE